MPKPSRKFIPYKMQKLGAYLKQQRTEIEVSLRFVALEIGMSPGHLFKIESGTFSNLNLTTLIKLSNVYGIPVGALLQEAGLVEKGEYELPDLPQYLRLKYHFSPHAIRDMEMAKEIVVKKYKLTPP